MSPSQLVADLGEHALIARLRARVPAPPASILVGIGDDAAVIAMPKGERLVITTDSLVEDVHFRRAWTTLDAVGHKALAVNLSDLASMGASPQSALLSLALPSTLTVGEFDALLDGLLALAASTNTPLVGGNMTRSPGPLVVDVTAVGSVRPRRVALRSGGRPGDELYVTGRLGAAATGLAFLQHGGDRSTASADLRACVGHYERPEPRLRAGLMAARSRAISGAIDLSDGLADAVRQLATASGTGATIEADKIPVHAGTRAWATERGADPLAMALSGGEDYELLFAVPRRRRRSFLAASNRWLGLPVTRIGSLHKDAGVWVSRAGSREPLPPGFVHF